MTVYAQLNSNATAITAIFAGPQSGNPNYAELEDNDARVTAWNAMTSAASAFGALMTGGLAITSTGTPALNGTYGVSPQDQINITSLQTAINTNSALFPGFYFQSNGAKVTLTAAQFTEIAVAVLTFVSALDAGFVAAQTGATPSWPSAAATIA